MTQEVSLVENYQLAEVMAYAEAPYREIGIIAAQHGLTDIVNEMNERASTASRQSEKLYYQAELQKAVESGELYNEHLAKIEITSRDNYMGKEHCLLLSKELGIRSEHITRFFTAIQRIGRRRIDDDDIAIPDDVEIIVRKRSEINFPTPYYKIYRELGVNGNWELEDVVQVGSIIDFIRNNLGKIRLQNVGKTMRKELPTLADYLESQVAQDITES